VTAVPRRLLRDLVSCRQYTGESGVGPVYAAAVEAYGRVQMERQLVRDREGVEVLSEMTVYLHPDDAAPYVPESEVTTGGRTSTVIASSTHSRPGQPFLTKVMCR